MVVDQDLPLVHRYDPAAGGGAAGDLPPGVGRPSAVAVRTRVDRVVQQEVQRRAVRPPPLQLTLVGPEVRADANADAVADQVSQQRRDGPQLVELVEDQPDDVPGLLIGVQR